MDEKCVENLALALVREYLSRKGYKQTLNCFDKESMKKDQSIQNRRILAETLCIIHLVKKNKERKLMYRCFLEMIVRDLKEQVISKRDQQHSNNKHNSKISLDNLDYNNNATETSSTLKQNSGESNVNKNENAYYNIIAVTKRDTVAVTPSFCRKQGSVSSPSPSKTATKIPRPKSPKSLSHASSFLPEGKSPEKSRIPVLFDSKGYGPKNVQPSVKDDQARQESNHTASNRESFIESVRRQKEQYNVISQNHPNPSFQGTDTNMNSIILEDCNTTLDEMHFTRKENPSHKPLHNDLTNQSTNFYFQSNPITFEISCAVKTLLFGSSTAFFNLEWRNQGFYFNKHSMLRYGLVQDKGGPCGLIAAVQAYILKNLLFNDIHGHTFSSIPQPDEKTQTELLVTSLTDILWFLRSKDTVIVPLTTPSIKFFETGRWKSDKFTEKLQLFHFNNREKISKFLLKNLSLFNRANGCMLFLYAMILTTGVQNIRNSMDEANATLIGRHGYCTQEMVNLMLTGHAVSNVFDGKIEMGKTVLHGLKARSKIGFLSLFEHYGSCQVGEYYKSPLYPIWLVCSESHFSVLFSLVDNTNEKGRTFDLYYYDELANQDEEIRLTVTSMPALKSKLSSNDLDLEPPLENCIRTKWKDAQISWNGTEPIL